MKLIFKSEAERLEHPYVKLIPLSLWEEAFAKEISELELKLLQSTTMYDFLKFFEEHYKKEFHYGDGNSTWRGWICIALGNPRASVDDLFKAASLLNINLVSFLQSAVALGYLPLVERIFTLKPDVIEQDSYFNYFICLALENGHLNLLRYLESRVSADTIQAITKTIEYVDAFYSAAKKGHLAVVHSEASKLPSKCSQEYIQVQKSLAFYQAAIYGRLDVLKEFAEKEPLEFHNMVKHNDFEAFRQTKEVEVKKFLLNDYDCFSFAQWREQYKEIVFPFMENVLSELKNTLLLKNKIEKATAGVLVPNKDRAMLCYYMIVNYIRRNDFVSNENIRFLINIPAVKGVLVQERMERLLLIARKYDNDTAVALLSTVVVVTTPEPEHSTKSDAQPTIKMPSDKKSSLETTTQTPIEPVLSSNYEKKLQHCAAVGKALLGQIERLQKGARSINPYWANSTSKLDKILKAVNALPEDIDEKALTQRVTTATDPLYLALNTPRLSRLTFLGQWNYDHTKSLHGVQKAAVKPPSK